MANDTTTNRPPRATRTTHSRLFRLIAIVILVLIVLVGLVVLITWLAIKPKRIFYTVDDGSIKNFNINTNRINATFGLVIMAHNPNRRISMYYDSIEVTVAVHGQTVAFNTLEPFYQPRKNVSRLDATLESRDVALSSSLSRDLRLEKRSGEAEIDVLIRARIRFKIGVMKIRHRTLKISCSSVKINFSSSKGFQRAYCDID
ncbi:hypothetical protein K2173_020908 [Erythroxylum novogranatense]|uniref:Late embryogenesis abundant protein LEA-2 subgroup domain-containing protein n=1 Tax=Erythroxylum novogranatense TaxID=1862640 RepID=A0AAV8TMG2_9ROSI|nr:hypothetical protein K2173_020908 [Erythroxylum novogranatense]